MCQCDCHDEPGPNWDVPGVGGGYDPLTAVTHLTKQLQEFSAALTATSDQAATPNQWGDALLALTRLCTQVTAALTHTAARAKRVEAGDHDTTGPTGTGETSRKGGAVGTTLGWWTSNTKLTRREASRITKLGTRLSEPEFTPTQARLQAGKLLPDQAWVIVDALKALPADVDYEIRAKAQDLLLSQAEEFDAIQLKVLGRRVLDVLAPEIAEDHEQKLLTKEEAKADAAAYLTITDDGRGTSHGNFKLPTAQAQMLRKQLIALAYPSHGTNDLGTSNPGTNNPCQNNPCQNNPGTGRTLTGGNHSQRLGHAFMEYIERFPSDGLPTAGGVNPTVIVTMTYDTLVGGLQAAALDTGTTITAGQARRLACEAGIIPAVLNGPSQPLDLGRTRRFHSKAQRLALAIRDKGCTAKHCTTPPAMCHSHHETPWIKNGSTDLNNSRLLCPKHHRQAHNADYRTHIESDNKITFTRIRQ